MAAIFAKVLGVDPEVNDSATVCAFSWDVSADKKTLTVTAKKSATPLLSLLGINILAAPGNSPNGTQVAVLVTGT